MDNEWESSFLTSRHVHNRNKANARQSSSKGASEFDVKRTYGSYEIKCPAADAFGSLNHDAEMQSSHKKKSKKRSANQRLEIYRLTDDGNGLIGELFLPGVLEATVILAGRRKQLEAIAANQHHPEEETCEEENSDEPPENNPEDEPRSAEEDSGDEGPSPSADNEGFTATHLTSNETKQQKRFKDFEKNSFRQPKFWLRWQGRVYARSDNDTIPEPAASGMGYVVFSGNKCRDFKGTLSCEALGWKDVSLRGWKRVEMKERDTRV
ncbi:hypothetical protein FZEAL_328 [Fusarium zealandicum]|uniref:Uncharacterized protein n=1 Tax=Fusarium zealandicum TaxID=1053134 RepID=A0A8H4UV09_9HYPO|nr:hypothetical protein FZEAL_328 [Fusarium zealandicum]